MSNVPAALAGKAAAAVSRFGAAVKPKLQGGIGGPEDQLRAPLEQLLHEVAAALGVELVLIGEASLAALGVRPDYAVNVSGSRSGYLELKAPGRGVPTMWTPNGHERRQWEQMRLLPNVLYTDGECWALLRSGELIGSVARLNGDLRHAGARLAPDGDGFIRVVSDFLLWKPDPPLTVSQLVKAAANLCKLLRGEVAETLAREHTGEETRRVFTGLAKDWRALLFPGLTDEEFADAYAQTVTFALLLARVDGIAFNGGPLSEIARQLGKKHSLMGKALSVLTEETVEGRSIVVATMLRVFGVVDWDRLSKGRQDTYLHLYEDFLEVYDQSLRKQSGSYYTPHEVVSAMARLVEEILRARMGIIRGFADDDVLIVDPAMGTGTFLLAVIDMVAATVAEEEGEPAVPPQVRSLFGRLVGFEKQACPFAVAELRVHQAVKAKHKTEVPEKEVKLFVADTLDNPYIEQTHLGLTYEPIARSRREANKIKREIPVVVVIGNPPYRDRAGGLGGWVEQGDSNSGDAPPLNTFRADGNGRYEYVLSNLSVYFWRWATWKVFDAHPSHPAGVVAFITTSAYTTGQGFAGMREYMRRTADEGWIIDLSPEGHQPEVNTRIFPGVQHPLCIGIFARYGRGNSDRPADIHHFTVAGLREQKFGQLERLTLARSGWRTCSTGWQERLTPAGDDAWLDYPLAGDLMPWQAPGVKPNRTWVYAPSPTVLKARWDRLISAPKKARAELIKETRDRRTGTVIAPMPTFAPHSGTIGDENGECPAPVRVGFRTFDRQYLIPDSRVVDFPRPVLWQVASDRQVFAIEQHDEPLTAGPGLVFTCDVPDIHFFRGRGGRVLPLYRDAACLAANIAPGVLSLIAMRTGMNPVPEDFLAYVAGVTAHSGYTKRFASALKNPGIRVPLTADAILWAEAVTYGREVLWLHTYGERFADPSTGRNPGSPKMPRDRRPKVVVTIPDTPEGMPDSVSYDEATRTLHVGTGQIRPVSPQAWAYETSGMKIVRKWFGYRKKDPAGRRSSPLDSIKAEHWPARFTTELLELLNVLEMCANLEPRQADLLARICDGPLITVSALRQERILPAPLNSHKPLPPDSPDMLTTA
jgi:Type ISP C-terminal specificity domain/N-6 DNA Methylase